MDREQEQQRLEAEWKTAQNRRVDLVRKLTTQRARTLAHRAHLTELEDADRVAYRDALAAGWTPGELAELGLRPLTP